MSMAYNVALAFLRGQRPEMQRSVRDLAPAAAIIAAILMFAGIRPAFAVTATSNLTVSITLTAECLITSVTTLDFGTQGVLAANVDNAGAVSVQCSNGQAYNIGLGAGNGAGATTTVRKMTGPASATINYSIYQNPGRTTNWGNVVATDTLAGTGNGTAVAIPIYGRIPPQTSPAAGAYTDTVQITVTY